MVLSNSFLQIVTILLGTLLALGQAQSHDGYFGYSLKRYGDADSALFETDNTPSKDSPSTIPPDVSLSASVHVGKADIEVRDLTVQANLAVQVLSQPNVKAGVDVSIDRVSLSTQDITANILLGASLDNVGRLVDDALAAIDLKSALLALRKDAEAVSNTATARLGAGKKDLSAVTTRGLALETQRNILYSVNDYDGNKHINHILMQDGTIVEQHLHNDGNVYYTSLLGDYQTSMKFNGHDVSVVGFGTATRALEYVYNPVHDVSVVSTIYFDATGSVVATRVLSESSVAWESTIDGQVH